MIERSLIEAAARLRRHGEPYVIATVVRARRLGARLVLTRYRWLAAGATGGVFDGELAQAAWMHTADGAPVVMRYDAAHPDIGHDEDLRAAFGLGDGDTVDVLIERAGAPGRVDVLELASRCVREQKRAAVATVVRSEGTSVRLGTRLALIAGGELAQDAPLDSELRDAILAELHVALESGGAVTRSIGGVDVLIEGIEPPPRLFVFGTGHDLVPLAQLARQVGWEVVICADTARHSTRERFVMADEIIVGEPADIAARIDGSARAICVIAGHDRDRDRACLALISATRARLIGVVGAAARHAGDDPRIVELRGDTALDRAFAAVAEARTRLAPRAPAASRAQADRPAPSRPSAVFAAVAAL